MNTIVERHIDCAMAYRKINKDPIFIHASPRSGSTYFFHVLRKNPHLMCFNEAISDVFHINYSNKWDAHHDFLYDDDLRELKVAWQHGIRPPPYPAFQNYCGITSDLAVYIAKLIKFAEGQSRRPVFCDIYSRYRARALREMFGGFHIAQIRDFMPQFGSFVRALADGGEWGFLALPWLEMGYPGIEAIDMASEKSIKDLKERHYNAMKCANDAAIRASHAIVNLPQVCNIEGVKLDLSDYKNFPTYLIPSEEMWRGMVRKHRPNLKIMASRPPFARHLGRIWRQWLSRERYS